MAQLPVASLPHLFHVETALIIQDKEKDHSATVCILFHIQMFKSWRGSADKSQPSSEAINEEEPPSAHTDSDSQSILTSQSSQTRFTRSSTLSQETAPQPPVKEQQATWSRDNKQLRTRTDSIHEVARGTRIIGRFRFCMTLSNRKFLTLCPPSGR